MTHLFAALELPQPARAHLAAALGQVRVGDGGGGGGGGRGGLAGLRWEDPAKWHVTVAFYGAVGPAQQADLVERLTRAARRATPFTARVAGAGAFTRPARARVLWAGVGHEPSSILPKLAASAAAAGRRVGLPVESRAYRPHVTLARASRPSDLTDLVRTLDGYAGPTWSIESLALVASLPLPAGSGTRYDVIQHVPLGRN